MRNKNYEMQELNDAAELLAQVEGATLSTGLTPVPWDDYPWLNDPIVVGPIRPPFQMMYGIWIPPSDIIKFN